MHPAAIALKWYAAHARIFENATRDPAKAQRKVLLEYVRRNRNTEYGRKYGFPRIATVADFRRMVPLADAGTMRPYIERMTRGEGNILTRDRPIFFGATSGTTSAPKLIPTTAFSERQNAGLIDLWSYYIARDHPAVLDGKIFTIVSPETEGRTPSGIAFGAESGRGYKHLPWAVKHLYVLPYEVFEIADYNARYYTMLRIGMAANVTDVATLNPNSLVLLSRKIEQWQDLLIADIEQGTLNERFAVPSHIRRALKGALKADPARAHELRLILKEVGTLHPRHFWPNLEIIECWKGGSVGLYLKELPAYFGNVAIRDLGCLSTEARCSIPMDDNGTGGVLAIRTNFYEFIPKEDAAAADKRTRLAHELEQGKEYFIVVTTPGGLYRYNIDDIVRVEGFFNATPVISFVQKGLYATSLAGEKLYEEQVGAALVKTLDNMRRSVVFFCAIPDTRGGPHYSLLTEFVDETGEQAARSFLAAMDAALRLENREYDYVRNAQLLGQPTLKMIKRGSFEQYKARRLREGAHDGQFKVPELTSDTAFEQNFEITSTVTL